MHPNHHLGYYTKHKLFRLRFEDLNSPFAMHLLPVTKRLRPICQLKRVVPTAHSNVQLFYAWAFFFFTFFPPIAIRSESHLSLHTLWKSSQGTIKVVPSFSLLYHCDNKDKSRNKQTNSRSCKCPQIGGIPVSAILANSNSLKELSDYKLLLMNQLSFLGCSSCQCWPA